MAEEKKYTANGALVMGIISPVVVVLFVVLYLPFSFYGAWCDQHLWNWFIGPYFHLPFMSIWVSFIVGSWARLQTTSFKVLKEEPKTKFWAGILLAIGSHTLAIGIGYLVLLHVGHK